MINEPSSHFGDNTLTRHTGVEDLKKESPEEPNRSVNTLTFSLRVRGGGEEVLREKRAEKSA
jgi:hypothetical protein